MKVKCIHFSAFICFVLIFAVNPLTFARGYRFMTVDHPDGIDTWPFDINNQGVVVGEYINMIAIRGFLYDGKSFADGTFPGSSWTRAVAINDEGVIAGNYYDDDGINPNFNRFKWRFGVSTEIAFLG